MTEPFDPAPSPDDEVVSAHLDGAATSEEAARVRSEPALSDRLDRFTDVASRVRDVPAPPPGAVEDHVAAAMAEFDAPGATSTGDDARVVDRREPGLWQRLPLGAVAAAAAVLVVVVGVVGVARTTGEDTTDTAAEDVGQDDGAAMGSTSDDAAELEASGVPAPSAFADRARFSDVDELADHLRAQLAPRPTASAEAGDAAGGADDAGGGTTATGSADGEDAQTRSNQAHETDPCGAVQLLGLDPSSVVALVAAVVGERDVTAVVHGAGEERRLVVVDDGTCTTIDERPV